MNYDFISFLNNRLVNISQTLNLEVDVKVSEEQTFAKMDELTPNSIYVVVKYLSSDIEYYAETMPIQILVLSEQNSLEKAQMLMNKFANDNNWQVIQENGTYIKQQYNSPVVLNNYTEVDYGYRSVLYVTGTLYIMENIVDVKNVTVDGEELKPLAFNISYSMSTNTQQLTTEEIASSLKTVSTFAITMTIAMRELEDHPGLITNVMKILNEQVSGNTPFVVKFDCGLEITKTMRLISAQITSAPNQIPGLQLGFMK